jgi:proteic killer suppression protein
MNRETAASALAPSEASPSPPSQLICPSGAVPILALLAVCPMVWYIASAGVYGMILSFRDDWLREFFVNDVRSKKIPSDLQDRLFRKIQMIDDATTDRDLRSPPSNHFEKLRGHLDGFHSIRINKRWRLVFRWNSGRGEAKDLYLDDHSYV